MALLITETDIIKIITHVKFLHAMTNLRLD